MLGWCTACKAVLRVFELVARVFTKPTARADRILTMVCRRVRLTSCLADARIYLSRCTRVLQFMRRLLDPSRPPRPAQIAAMRDGHKSVREALRMAATDTAGMAVEQAFDKVTDSMC